MTQQETKSIVDNGPRVSQGITGSCSRWCLPGDLVAAVSVAVGAGAEE